MNELCNDGQCWTVAEVFGLVRATPHATPRNVPRTVAGSDRELDSIYWQNGQWHNRRPATSAMIRKEQQAADNAAGVGDGAESLTRKGNDRIVRRSLKAIGKRVDRDLARAKRRAQQQH